MRSVVYGRPVRLLPNGADPWCGPRGSHGSCFHSRPAPHTNDVIDSVVARSRGRRRDAALGRVVRRARRVACSTTVGIHDPARRRAGRRRVGRRERVVGAMGRRATIAIVSTAVAIVDRRCRRRSRTRARRAPRTDPSNGFRCVCRSRCSRVRCPSASRPLPPGSRRGPLLLATATSSPGIGAVVVGAPIVHLLVALPRGARSPLDRARPGRARRRRPLDVPRSGPAAPRADRVDRRVSPIESVATRRARDPRRRARAAAAHVPRAGVVPPARPGVGVCRVDADRLRVSPRAAAARRCCARPARTASRVA